MKTKYKPRCFLDVEIEGEKVGRIILELFSDTCPKTCENFRALCTGEKGIGKQTGKALYYKGTPFHRIVKDFMIQSGDFSNNNGTGGESIYGGVFPDENFAHKHDKPYLLSMANRGKNTNGSQFFITTQPAPHLDGKHVVFGCVIDGHDVVRLIERQPTDTNNRPSKDVRISHCGELVLQKVKSKKQKKDVSSGSDSEVEESDSSSSGSEAEKKKKKKKKKLKKKKKHRKKNKKDSAEEGEIQEEQAYCSSVRPEEIPKIPENKFLMRGSQDEKPPERRQPVVHSRQPRERNGQHRSASPLSRGYYQRPRRKRVKGRGTVRYSPSRDRSRSITPPHWRREINRTVKLSELMAAKDDKPRDEKWAKGDMLNSVENISPRHRKRQREDEHDDERKQRKRRLGERLENRMKESGLDERFHGESQGNDSYRDREKNKKDKKDKERFDKSDRTRSRDSSEEESMSDNDDYDGGRPLSQRPASSLNKSHDLDAAKTSDRDRQSGDQQQEMRTVGHSLQQLAGYDVDKSEHAEIDENEGHGERKRQRENRDAKGSDDLGNSRQRERDQRKHDSRNREKRDSSDDYQDNQRARRTSRSDYSPVSGGHRDSYRSRRDCDHRDSRSDHRDSRSDHRDSRSDHRDFRSDRTDSRSDHRDSRHEHRTSRRDHRDSRSDQRDSQSENKDSGSDHRDSRKDRASRKLDSERPDIPRRDAHSDSEEQKSKGPPLGETSSKQVSEKSDNTANLDISASNREHADSRSSSQSSEMSSVSPEKIRQKYESQKKHASPVSVDGTSGDVKVTSAEGDAVTSKTSYPKTGSHSTSQPALSSSSEDSGSEDESRHVSNNLEQVTAGDKEEHSERRTVTLRTGSPRTSSKAAASGSCDQTSINQSEEARTVRDGEGTRDVLRPMADGLSTEDVLSSGNIEHTEVFPKAVQAGSGQAEKMEGSQDTSRPSSHSRSKSPQMSSVSLPKSHSPTADGSRNRLKGSRRSRSRSGSAPDGETKGFSRSRVDAKERSSGSRQSTSRSYRSRSRSPIKKERRKSATPRKRSRSPRKPSENLRRRSPSYSPRRSRRSKSPGKGRLPSPRRRQRSPQRRSRSLRRSRSPRRKSKSPRKRSRSSSRSPKRRSRRSRTPRRRSRTPRRRSRTPRRRSRTPRRRSRTPRRRSRTPRRRSRTPRRRSRTPRRRSRTPRRRSRSPRRRSRSPQKRSRSPRRRSRSRGADRKSRSSVKVTSPVRSRSGSFRRKARSIKSKRPSHSGSTSKSSSGSPSPKRVLRRRGSSSESQDSSESSSESSSSTTSRSPSSSSRSSESSSSS